MSIIKFFKRLLDFFVLSASSFAIWIAVLFFLIFVWIIYRCGWVL